MPRWVEAEEATKLLVPYGLMPVGGVAGDPLEASRLADKFGFPVAVKVADSNIVHKTDRGLVRVGLESPAEVIAATRAFARELGREDVPVIIQPVVDGVEVALGVVRDPGFGPLVMVAAGGIATGILEDRAFLLPPFTERDAARAVRSLRIWPLLDGYRGSPRTDVAGLVDLLVTLGQLAHRRAGDRGARLQPGHVHAIGRRPGRRQGAPGGCVPGQRRRAQAAAHARLISGEECEGHGSRGRAACGGAWGLPGSRRPREVGAGTAGLCRRHHVEPRRTRRLVPASGGRL